MRCRHSIFQPIIYVDTPNPKYGTHPSEPQFIRSIQISNCLQPIQIGEK